MKRKENKRKPGRSCKEEEVLGRERSASVSSVRSMAEFVKRKKEEVGNGNEREEKTFKRSKSTERLPVKK